MDRQPHDYSAAAMAFAQQQQQAANIQQQQQFGFHPQHQQFPPSVHGPPFIPPHPSMQPYPSQHMQQGQFHPHPAHPHLAHIQQQQQLPPSFPPHLPPHIVPSPLRGSYDSPPPAPPPSDPEVQKCIDKLVEYAAKHGPEFEAMVRENQKDNPAYSFLFGGDGHNYYRYTLWLATRPPGGPFNPPFPASNMPVMRPPNPMVNPSPANAPQLNVPGSGLGASSSMLNAPPLHQSPFPPFYDQQNPQPFSGHIGGHVRHDYEQSRNFKGLSGPLPSDVAMELNNVLNGLTGTKESIKGAKQWFMQRSPFAPALAEALRDRVYALNDPERQLHIVYLSNDILFDSLQRRINTHELDNEALAFKPVFGSMLARIYHNPQNKEENQSRLQKILQFWASKEVYDHETIRVLESEMMGGLVTNSFAGHPQRDFSSVSADPSTFSGIPHQAPNHNALHWQSEKPNFPDQEHRDKQFPSLSSIPQQFLPNSGPAAGFPGAIPMLSSGQSTNLQSAPQLLPAQTTNVGEKLPPYPLFPPGLIPGMVRKMQIGSGVPYSPMSPLDIPTMIPPSTTSPSEILERVSKFFREIGEANPSEGPMNSVESKGDDDEYERDSPVRKGGACIPPPPNLQVDPETGTLPDGSVERTPGSISSGRLGLGATANPNEASQYDDVYSSYRKQRSTNYHTSMSARSTTAPTR